MCSNLSCFVPDKQTCIYCSALKLLVSGYLDSLRLQNSPYFCVFKYTRAVKQKVWNEAENRERDWGFLSPHTPVARALRAGKTLTPRFTDFFTDFEKKTDCFAVYDSLQARHLSTVDHQGWSRRCPS